ncbi:c6 transcription factor [Colletotrichum incanum]|uniref:C6 transcription factor n=1 Tax=Colletotrichum incanum TaxID=1573173 RepID=A0A162Q8H1_COLIC|nr:c6 transcription factor [Colletotrichum incanum]
MITLPSPYANVDGYADDLLRFIDTPLFRQITGDIHVNDALIYNAWEALPSEWTAWWTSIPDHRLVQQDLIDSIEEPARTSSTNGDPQNDGQTQYLRDRPESLAKWLKTLQSLSLPRVQRLNRKIILPDVLTGRMKTKKIAEVSTAAAYIQSVCQANNITHVIDMGSGQGYLSVSLAFLFPNLRVLAIDGSESQIAASKASAASLGITECRIQHMRRYIDGTAPLVAEMADWAGGENCMLVGLHACGSLSEHMLRDVVLSATALMTGCQAPNNWERADLSKEESEYSKRRFYRALLEKVFFDKGIELNKENRPVWGIRKGDTASFTRFTRRAVEFLGINGDEISDDELTFYEDRYQGYNKSVIALDRYWFLIENGGRNVDVLPVFDYKTSPRNLMLVANKGSRSGNNS